MCIIKIFGGAFFLRSFRPTTISIEKILELFWHPVYLFFKVGFKAISYTYFLKISGGGLVPNLPLQKNKTSPFFSCREILIFECPVLFFINIRNHALNSWYYILFTFFCLLKYEFWLLFTLFMTASSVSGCQRLYISQKVLWDHYTMRSLKKCRVDFFTNVIAHIVICL